MYAGIIETPSLRQENFDGFVIGKAKPLAGVKSIDEIDSPLLSMSNQLKKILPLLGRIGLHPVSAMIRIALRSVKKGVHSSSRAKFKQCLTMRHAPEPSKAAFSEAPT